jgi:hypothetical protein
MDNPRIPALFEEVVPFTNTRGKNDRFDYAKVRKGNTWFFLKSAKTKEFVSNIQREIVWTEFMNRIEAFYPDSHLFGPKIERRIGLDGLVFSYVNAPVVAEPGELEAWQRVLRRYAEMLVIFDTVAVNWKAENLPDEPSRSDHVYVLWERWLGDNIERYPRLPEAKKRLESVHFLLTKCLQHGDLTPWQIFDTGDSWVVYDGEKCGTDLFRYTDLAYGYARLYTTLGSPIAAQELLRTFIEKRAIEQDAFMKEFLPVLLHRAVGCMADAYNDQQTHDYVLAAEELVTACLDKNIPVITG